MDTHVKGGFAPSSLVALIAALPKLCLNKPVQGLLQCSDEQLKWAVKTSRIAPPIESGSRRIWLDTEVATMARHEDLCDIQPGAGHRQLDQRIAVLDGWLNVALQCADRFDLEHRPTISRTGRVQDCPTPGLVNLQSACRGADSYHVWHRLPYTYGTARHHRSEYAHLSLRRRGRSQVFRTVDIIAMNLSEAIAQAMAVRTQTA